MVTIKEDHDSRAVVNNDAAGEGGWPEDSESVVLHVINPLVDNRFFILCKEKEISNSEVIFLVIDFDNKVLPYFHFLIEHCVDITVSMVTLIIVMVS